jgi:hypothetical protein
MKKNSKAKKAGGAAAVRAARVRAARVRAAAAPPVSSATAAPVTTTPPPAAAGDLSHTVPWWIYGIGVLSVVFIPVRHHVISQMFSYWWFRMALVCVILHLSVQKYTTLAMLVAILYVLGVNTFVMQQLPLVTNGNAGTAAAAAPAHRP